MSDPHAVATRTGSFPAISERPSPPPPPPHGTPEWYAWIERQIRGLQRDLAQALPLVAQIGRPPIPSTGDPGDGMWAMLAGVRDDLTKVLAKLDAADQLSATWGGRASRVAWRAVETLIPLGIGWALLWLSGWHR